MRLEDIPLRSGMRQSDPRPMPSVPPREVARVVVAIALGAAGGLVIHAITLFTNWDLSHPFASLLLRSLPMLLAIGWGVRHLRRRKKCLIAAKYLLCPRCVFPLTGLPAKGACPECGTAYEQDQVRRSWLRAYPLRKRGQKSAHNVPW